MNARGLPSPVILGAVCLVVGAAAAGTPSDSGSGQTVDWVWSVAAQHLCCPEAAARLTGPAHAALLRAAAAAPDDRAVVDSINVFLRGLGLSHTELLTPADVEYHLFLGLSLSEPVSHIGMQTRREGGSHRILAVWDGLPADLAGLRRGDLVVAADGEPFEPILSFTGGTARTLTVLRGADTLRVRVEPVSETIPESLRRATLNSVRRIRTGDAEFGYLHVWTCLDTTLRAGLPRILEGELAGVDGLILDLRNGFGGWWQACLGPFFGEGTAYSTAIVRYRSGARDTLRYAARDEAAEYAGPLVVLINEGSRSGLECLAYDLRRRERTWLVGARTSGAVLGARWWFSPIDDLVLYLPVNTLELNGETLEGKGVRPDLPVLYPADDHLAPDPQFHAAVELLKAEESSAPLR